MALPDKCLEYFEEMGVEYEESPMSVHCCIGMLYDMWGRAERDYQKDIIANIAHAIWRMDSGLDEYELEEALKTKEINKITLNELILKLKKLQDDGSGERVCCITVSEEDGQLLKDISVGPMLDLDTGEPTDEEFIWFSWI